MKSGIESGETNNRLAFRVQPFCKSIGIGRTKFYDWCATAKSKPLSSVGGG